MKRSNLQKEEGVQKGKGEPLLKGFRSLLNGLKKIHKKEGVSLVETIFFELVAWNNWLI